MARRRMIDPDIWQDEKFAQLNFEGRLLFIGLITQSNDFGKLRGNPKLLKSTLFPYDDDQLKIEEYLNKLHELGIIQIYEVNKEKFIKIKNWEKYQTLTYKGKDNIPEPILNKPLINPEPILNKPLKASRSSRSKDKLSKDKLKEVEEAFQLLHLKDNEDLLWLKELQEKYSNINFIFEVKKMLAWCKDKNIRVARPRSRLANWLEKGAKNGINKNNNRKGSEYAGLETEIKI